MGDCWLVKETYSDGCARYLAVRRPEKRWIESIKECLRESHANFVEARRKVHNSCETQG